MDPDIWGPSAWKFLHSVSFTYPLQPSNQDKEHYKQFFEQLCYVLPCIDCCFNYQKEIETYDIDEALTSRVKLTRWVVDIHNSVNRRLGKREMKYSVVKKTYDDYLKERTWWDNYKLYVLTGIGICGFLIFMNSVRYIKRKK